MAKLKLVAAPTFKANVGVPIAGGDPVPVEFTFRHRTKKVLLEWMGSRGDKSDADSFMDMVEGWELEDAFGRDSVEQLLDNYPGAALVTYQVYIDELLKNKTKN